MGLTPGGGAPEMLRLPPSGALQKTEPLPGVLGTERQDPEVGTGPLSTELGRRPLEAEKNGRPNAPCSAHQTPANSKTISQLFFFNREATEPQSLLSVLPEKGDYVSAATTLLLCDLKALSPASRGAPVHFGLPNPPVSGRTPAPSSLRSRARPLRMVADTPVPARLRGRAARAQCVLPASRLGGSVGHQRRGGRASPCGGPASPRAGVDFGRSWKTAWGNAVSQACRHHLLSVWRDPRAVSVLLLELRQVGTGPQEENFSLLLTANFLTHSLCSEASGTTAVWALGSRGEAQEPILGYLETKPIIRGPSQRMLLRSGHLSVPLPLSPPLRGSRRAPIRSRMRFYPEMLWDFHVLRHCQGDSQRPRSSGAHKWQNKGYLAFNTTDGTLFHFDLPSHWLCNLIGN
ncbi:uncharacterized protein [Manis javanica]|uniref:uncharacterized protein n=1 Tax=Manis javanica TaxID=9974 RepID=UPI003C6DAC01